MSRNMSTLDRWLRTVVVARSAIAIAFVVVAGESIRSNQGSRTDSSDGTELGHRPGTRNAAARSSRLVVAPDCPAALCPCGEEDEVGAGVAVADRVVRRVEAWEVDVYGDRSPPELRSALALDPAARQPVADEDDQRGARAN